MEYLENKYEAFQGDIETLIISQRELGSIGNDLKINIFQVDREKHFAKGERKLAQ